MQITILEVISKFAATDSYTTPQSCVGIYFGKQFKLKYNLVYTSRWSSFYDPHTLLFLNFILDGKNT